MPQNDTSANKYENQGILMWLVKLIFRDQTICLKKKSIQVEKDFYCMQILQTEIILTTVTGPNTEKVTFNIGHVCLLNCIFRGFLFKNGSSDFRHF